MIVYCMSISQYIYPIYCCWVFALFLIFALLNKATTNFLSMTPDTHVQDILWYIYLLELLSYIGTCVLLICRYICEIITYTYPMWKSYLNNFESGWTKLYSYPQSMRVPVAPRPCKQLLLPDFLNVCQYGMWEMISH